MTRDNLLKLVNDLKYSYPTCFQYWLSQGDAYSIANAVYFLNTFSEKALEEAFKDYIGIEVEIDKEHVNDIWCLKSEEDDYYDYLRIDNGRISDEYGSIFFTDDVDFLEKVQDTLNIDYIDSNNWQIRLYKFPSFSGNGFFTKIPLQNYSDIEAQRVFVTVPENYLW